MKEAIRRSRAAVKTITESPDETVIHLTITEGKYHQVKLMAKAVGNEVAYLKRLSMGAVSLDPELKPGEFRELTEEELAALKDAEM